jgi:hypothetical protein
MFRAILVSEDQGKCTLAAMSGFSVSTLLDQDEPAKVGKDQGVNVLSEMNGVHDSEVGDPRRRSAAVDIS